MLEEIKLFIGLGRDSTSQREKAVSLITSTVGILSVFLMGRSLDTAALFSNCFVLIPMAASAVLLFAIPHGALSQPWPILGGHVISALIGVSCKKLFGSNLISASVAVGTSIYFMSLLRCIHPPGGATSLSAVIGGEPIYSLGFFYTVFPVAYSCLIMISLAFLLNFPFKWRRYPAHIFHLMNPVAKFDAQKRRSEVTLEDFLYAVKKHDSYIDVTDETWVEIFELAKQNAELQVKHPEYLISGKCYSNGKLGKEWEVRKILGIDPECNIVNYLVVAGKAVNQSSSSNESFFKEWAKFEVENVNNSWVKVYK